MKNMMKNFLLWKSKRVNTNNQTDEMKRIISNDSDFNTVETYKSIRTNIMFSMPKKDKGKVIAITSSSPGEGKTTTCINLAITFAQTGAKVILVDCDLRKSRIHRYLGIQRDDGVSNVICNYTEIDKAIKKNVRENLDCMTAGEIPPNPAEILDTEEFKAMLDKLTEKYDYIFIDTPPMTVVTDAAVIMKKDMGVVVVVRENVTTFDLLDITIDNIKKTETKLLGVIMLGSEEKKRKYGYYSTGKYGYRYNYNYHYGDKQNKEK